MKYHELTLQRHYSSKRRGRGIASGKGKTAGRGTKGQGARTGSTRRPGFTGGQNPLMQRLPKLPGFQNHRPKATTMYTGQLEQWGKKTVDAQMLADKGLIPNPFVVVKVITGKGELTKPVSIRLQAASASAIAAIQKAGGSFEAVPRMQRPQKGDSKSQSLTSKQNPKST
jgi:large subunit ribosomal protein L15